MDKAEIVKINPLNIEDELKGPVLTGLMEKGWTVQTTVLLEDPRVAQGHPDRMKLGLIMFPPHEGRGQVVIKETAGPGPWVWPASALIAVGIPVALILARMI